MKPTIILALGRPKLLPPGAIAIDFKNNCFWRGVRRRPQIQRGAGRKPIYSPAPFRILALLVMRSPGIVLHDEIMEYLWDDDPNGGPDDAANYVRKRIDIARNGPSSCRKNAMLPWLGAEVKSYYQRGFSLEFIEKPALQADRIERAA